MLIQSGQTASYSLCYLAIYEITKPAHDSPAEGRYRGLINYK